MYRINRRQAAMLVFAFLFSVGSGAWADDAPTSRPQRTPIYDTDADAHKQIAAALRRAKLRHQRVLVMFGGNWCGWCYRLDGLFTNDQRISRLLDHEYERVMVDVGRFDKHLDIAKQYGIDLKRTGVPFLTVLDADGNVLVNQETGALEKGEAHHPGKVLSFLLRWRAEPADANQVLSDALATAQRDNRQAFLYLTAPWCMWCSALNDFLCSERVVPIITRDYVVVAIDQDRMKNGRQVARRFRDNPRAGMPWFTVLTSDGKRVPSADHDATGQGFPAGEERLTAFIKLLRENGPHITDADAAVLKQELERFAKVYRARFKAKLKNTAGG